MYRRSWHIAAALGLALIAGGCGTVAVGKSAPAWNGAKAWSSLSKLGNYSYTSSVLEGYDLQAEEIVQSASYADAGDFTATLHGASARFSWLGVARIVRTGGQFFGYVAYPTPHSGFKVGWYRFGSVLKAPYNDIMTNFELISGLWSKRLAASSASYAGTCSSAGRTGYAYTVHFRLPQGVGLKVGDGSACVDRATGAVLKVDFVLHAKDPTGSPVVFQDHFRVTQVGGIPVPSDPAGTKTAPRAIVSP